MAKFYQISPITILTEQPPSDLDSKVDKVPGKGLSTKDFTKNYANKVIAIEAGAEVNVNADWNAISGDAQILNKPTDLTDLSVHSLTELPDYINVISDISGNLLTVGAGLSYYYDPSGNTGYITNTGVLAETDPAFLASPAYNITQTDIDNWDAASGGGITSLTGDVTATGPGAAAATLANTTVTPGAYTNADITVDSKGRITAAANGTSNPGTVTSFSSGNLSPLFTTSVADSTSTPALSFTLSNAAANTYLGNATGSPAAPSYTSAAALTKTDDSNVTLTLGGNPSTALLTDASLTLGWTGQLPVTRGGTGAATFTNNRVLTGNGTSAIVDEANLTFDGTTLTIAGTGSYSADTTLASIKGTVTTTANGVDIVGIRSAYTAANDGTPTSNTFAGGTLSLSTNTTTSGILYGLSLGGTNTSPNISQFYGLNARLDENSATGSLSSRYAMDFLLVKGAQDATSAHSFTGTRVRLQDSTSTGRITTGIGSSIGVENAVTGTGAQINVSNSKGTANTQFGIVVNSGVSGAGVTVANSYGTRYVPAATASGVMTNYYSILNNTAPVATNSWFLYNSQNYRNYLNGNLALGVDVTTAKLFVRGTGTTSATYSMFAENSSGTDYFKLNDAGQLYLGSSTPNAAAIFQADSTTQGFLPPRMTTTQRDAISSPPAGLMIYNTTTSKLNVYTTAWEQITSA